MKVVQIVRICSVLVWAGAAALAQPNQNPDPSDITPEEAATQQHYDQALRPQFHYTPIQGHIGDATGLIYYRGQYHLFNMYDEWSRRRLAHKRWGHAVSPDLIHWEQLAPVLDTLIDHRPGSGSGVVDWNNSSGLRRGPEKTLIIFYTDYQAGTCIAYSRDGGRTWVRHQSNPIIAGAEDARDPTVFWHAQSGEWRMVRYEKRGFAFYGSRDLLHWSSLSRIDGYFECPDLFELPVINRPGQQRWVLIDGDASYFIGRFDGSKFVPETSRLKVEYGPALYATQTWKLTMEGGPVYQMGWMRYPNMPRLTWNGQMSFPVELTLRELPEGIRLCRQPIDEVKNLRLSQQTWKNLKIGSGSKPIDDLKTELLDLRVEMKPESSGGGFGIQIYGQTVRYSMTEEKISLGSIAAPLRLRDGTLRLRILVDRSSIEVFADDGQVSLSAITLNNPDRNVNLFAEGGAVGVPLLEANGLESIWIGFRQ